MPMGYSTLPISGIAGPQAPLSTHTTAPRPVSVVVFSSSSSSAAVYDSSASVAAFAAASAAARQHGTITVAQ